MLHFNLQILSNFINFLPITVKIFLDSTIIYILSLQKTFLILSIYYINKLNVQILNNILTDND